MKLIVGLGNPDRQYSGNRHNIGFMCVNHFAKTHHIGFEKKQGLARLGTGRVDGNEVVVARPQTYMNASGESVKKLMDRFKIRLDDLIVIHDDLDLPVGKIRIRSGGSSGGHKGINSIIACLGSRDFTRIKVGIGRPGGTEDRRENEVVDYVLSDFSRDERAIISETVARVSEAILCLLTEGLETAMNKFN